MSSNRQLYDAITYSFRDELYNGPLDELSTGRTKYILQTINKVFSSGPTTVMTTDGSLIGIINWDTLTKSMTVELHGKSVPGDTFIKSRSGGFLKPSKNVWVDESGDECYWQSNQCYNSRKEIIAHFTPRVPHLFGPSEPALLSIDRGHQFLFDRLLLTLIVTDRWNKRRAAGASASAAGASAAGAC